MCVQWIKVHILLSVCNFSQLLFLKVAEVMRQWVNQCDSKASLLLLEDTKKSSIIFHYFFSWQGYLGCHDGFFCSKSVGFTVLDLIVLCVWHDMFRPLARYIEHSLQRPRYHRVTSSVSWDFEETVIPESMQYQMAYRFCMFMIFWVCQGGHLLERRECLWAGISFPQ